MGFDRKTESTEGRCLALALIYNVMKSITGTTGKKCYINPNLALSAASTRLRLHFCI